MRRRRAKMLGRGRADHAGHTNVTPLIDVVMCLIVFYLIVGRLAGDAGAAKLTPPSTHLGEQTAAPRVVLSVAPGGQDQSVLVRVEGKEVALDELAGTIGRLAGDVSTSEVGVRADRRLSWGQVRPVVDACRAAGVRTIKLITARAEGGS